eukprot:362020-Chlamydomonas_euryale.AAC.1
MKWTTWEQRSGRRGGTPSHPTHCPAISRQTGSGQLDYTIPRDKKYSASWARPGCEPGDAAESCPPHKQPPRRPAAAAAAIKPALSRSIGTLLGALIAVNVAEIASAPFTHRTPGVIST